VAGETGRVISETRCITDEKALRIFHKRLKGVRVFSPIRPSKNSAVRDSRARHGIVHKKVHQVNAVTHPLIGDAAGKLAIQTKFKINTRIKWAVRFVHEPFGPVGIRFSNLAYLLASAPAGTVIVPHNFDLAYVAKSATLYGVPRCFRMWLTSMLRSHLYDD